MSVCVCGGGAFWGKGFGGGFRLGREGGRCVGVLRGCQQRLEQRHTAQLDCMLLTLSQSVRGLAGKALSRAFISSLATGPLTAAAAAAAVIRHWCGPCKGFRLSLWVMLLRPLSSWHM